MDLYLQQRKDPQHGGQLPSVYPGAGDNETWVLEAAETEGPVLCEERRQG